MAIMPLQRFHKNLRTLEFHILPPFLFCKLSRYKWDIKIKLIFADQRLCFRIAIQNR